MVYLYLQAKCKLKTGRYQFQEAVQDSMLGLKKLYQAVLGKGQKNRGYSTSRETPRFEIWLKSICAEKKRALLYGIAATAVGSILLMQHAPLDYMPKAGRGLI